jgi:hypothetical protein
MESVSRQQESDVRMSEQIVGLLIHAIPVACVTWTLTREEVLAELRRVCVDRSRCAGNLLERKFYYAFTCEYCLSHWMTGLLLLLTGYRLWYDDWRGVLMAFFAVAWVANAYMSLYQRLRVEIRKERAIADQEQEEAKQVKSDE